MSATAKRGSNAPYTVVPAVALTRKGTNPYANEKAPRHVKHGFKDSLKIAGKSKEIPPLIQVHFWSHQKGH